MISCKFSGYKTSDMRKLFFILFLVSCIASVNAQKKPSGFVISQRFEKIINSQWTFNYFPDENADKGYESLVTMIQNGRL